MRNRDNEWVIRVDSKDSIFFYNSISAESGPWRWSYADRTVTDTTGAYGTREVRDPLARWIDETIAAGGGRGNYSPDDLVDDDDEEDDDWGWIDEDEDD